MRRVLRRRAAALGAGAALALLGGLAAGVPGASGGFTARITNSTDTAGTANYFTCQPAIAADKAAALFQWPLADASGATTATDISGSNRTGTYTGSVVSDASTPIACPRDGGSAWRLDGSTSAAYYGTSQTNPQVFTLEVDFQTTVKGGKLIGFGSSTTGASAQYDRQLYLNKNGAVVFGVYPSAYRTLTSPASTYADGAWHHVAATLSASGMALHLDGRLVASDAATTSAQVFNGYWRVGYDTIGPGWSNAPTNPWFTGRLRAAAVYTSALTAQQIANHAAPTF
ncbi:LamG-like jellyroll fold domain-containing protein [uncultured Amnibacterium sp.]|uniref:LamG-like jellyroll fold domain-containing protein n=1 Tax=uncultured Amnibacterium sp. TaxID=1631851 RepID=UPI0035CA5F7F